MVVKITSFPCTLSFTSSQAEPEMIGPVGRVVGEVVKGRSAGDNSQLLDSPNCVLLMCTIRYEGVGCSLSSLSVATGTIPVP